MASSIPQNTPASCFESGIQYQHLLECVHCGLCTSACPTYLELGTEMDSPRGRIHLMRAATDGRLELDASVAKHLDLCLDCRSCESACPSGVKYGQLIEPFRVAMREKNGAPEGPLLRTLLLHLFPFANRMRLALAPARLLQRIGLFPWLARSPLVRLLPRALQGMLAMTPRYRPALPPLPEFLEAKGKRRATVGLFLGCVGDAVFRHVHWATARVLQENGCDVWIPREQTCCGAIHYHAGEAEPAVDRAIQNARVFSQRPLDAVIVNVAGCGAMLKEYHHLPMKESQSDGPETPAKERDQVLAFSHQVRDISEFLDTLGIVPPTGPIDMTMTYHDACHLAHAQQIRKAPRSLLGKVPGLRLVPLAESEVCCGAAGTYNLTQPQMAGQLAERKVRNIEKTGASAVLIGNAGCTLHLDRALQAHAAKTGNTLPIYHPIEILDWSYRNQNPSP